MNSPVSPIPVPVKERDITRAVVWNQALWTAGWSLSSGGFLAYFARELGSGGLVLALILAVPETVGIVGLWARPIVRVLGSRKGVWLGFSLAARAVSIGIPLLAFESLRPGIFESRWILVLLLAVSQALQAIAFMAMLSWLADLVPKYHWGHFFARQNIAKLCVLMVVPVVAGYAKESWLSNATPAKAPLGYVVAFGLGNLLLLCSIVPLLRFPNVPVRATTIQKPNWSLLVDAFSDRSFRFLLIHSWWLAFANGLTQVAFFRYRIDALGITLGMYYVIDNVMHLVKIPVSSVSGYLSDHFGNKSLLFWSTLTASAGIPFWFLATSQHWWWIFGASVCWGAYAAVNISGRNLMLTLAPRGDNATHIALFYQVAGLLAGASGILGGIWLDSLEDSKFRFENGSYLVGACQVVFLVSFLGRVTAAFWLLPIQEPGAKRVGWILRTWKRWHLHRKRLSVGDGEQRGP